ncbi:hypothetical protein [Streptomyces sp. NPDC059970]|uniref:hypothetical protein n=1 Tax=Streptomyces sp. NPDC059970 TaxID=3347019 RepID=UPI0036C6B2D7
MARFQFRAEGGLARLLVREDPKGIQIQVIAETLGLDRKTVRRYAHAATPDDASLATGSRSYGQVHAYAPYLHRRWNEGCTDAAWLHVEIVELGYRGSKRTVRRHLQEIRVSGEPAPAEPRELTVRKATWLITAHPDKISESNALKLKQLLARCWNWKPSPTACALSPR